MSGPFDFRSIYDDADDEFFARRTPIAHQRSANPTKPFVSVGEIYNDTSSGYSTASGASTGGPSTATLWTRKENAPDFEFVPIQSDAELRTPKSNGPEWRQRKRDKYFDPPSINDLLNSFDNFDPEPLLQRAVKASQRVQQYVDEAPRFRRSNTALGDPFPSERQKVPTTVRRGSSGGLDLNDFPSQNRVDQFRSLRPIAESRADSPAFGHSLQNPREVHSNPLNQSLPHLHIPTERPNVDTSLLDSVLNSPNSDFRRQLPDLDDEMARTTSNWKETFGAMRERFGLDEEDPLLKGIFATDGSVTIPRSGRGGFLSKSASHNTIPNGDRKSLLESAVKRRAAEAPDQTSEGGDRPRLRNQLGNFWIESVRNRMESPTGFVRSFSPRLSAAERLEQLHEPIDPEEGKADHVVYRRPGAVDNVASRRAQYLKETFRSQSPLLGSNGNKSNSQIETNGHQTTPNLSALDSAVADMNGQTTDRYGCGRFPTTNEIKYSTTTNNPDGSTTRSYFGQTAFSAPGGVGTTVVTTSSRTTTQHSPSPDTLSDTSQQSLIFLPHPRPKHNIREQLMNAGVGLFGSSGFPSRRLLTNGSTGSSASASSSPNFPAPTTGGVASRISALEKSPGTPNLLQLACVLTNDTPAAPMSPRSTVFRKKPVIHVDYGSDTDGAEVFQFPADKQMVCFWTLFFLAF